MGQVMIDQYFDALIRCIPAKTAKRNELLFTSFVEHFPTPLRVKQMTRKERELVLSWGPEMRSVMAGIDLGRLVASSHNEVCGHAYSSTSLGKAMIDHFREAEQESVVVAFTDVHNEIIDMKTIFRGGQSECLLYPDRIFSRALRQSASGLVMVHNHPSGEVQPSVPDRAFANRLDQGSKLLGLCLLDFLIVGKDRYYSWREEQQITAKK